MRLQFLNHLITSVLVRLCVAVHIFALVRCLPAEQAPLLQDFVGLNGHTVQFKPDLYQPICRLVRDYHPVSWDLGTNTSEAPPFPFAKNRVDWSKVYGSWGERGWRIDVSLMFESVERPLWKNLEADARAYGEAFAREFGPSGKRKLVESAEIGNEPGKWPDSDYSRLFRAMAEGIRAGDPALTILTCNMTTGKSGSYEKSVKCVAEVPELYDVLNVHSYAQLENWPTWRRSFPEDPKLPKHLQDIEALCHWRDQHDPGKPVWVTEFGYDSSTRPAEKSGDFSKWVGVTDEQQAQWLVRSLLVYSAMPVARAYLYFFNDKDEPRLHASSGITRDFKPKPSFYALAQFQRLLGDYRFDHIVINEVGKLRVQEYHHGSDARKSAWAVWSPTGEGKRFSQTLNDPPGKLLDAQPMTLTPRQAGMDQPAAAQHIEVEVTESPLYLFFARP